MESLVRFSEIGVGGAVVVEMEQLVDERGFFARVFDSEIFEQQGLEPRVAQCNYSHSDCKGTLRGLHWQAEPYAEARLVRCIAGAIYDVVLDVRPGSVTNGKWAATELSASNGLSLYVPPGVAHGFLTLADDCDVLYQASSSHVAQAERGVRWDDPAFSIEWPFEPAVITDKDRSWPDALKEVTP